MENKNLYKKDSIQSLDPREFTRLKPQVYCGSTEYSTQLLIEIISNSVDEVVLGHGNKVEITTGENGFVSVRDYGQGFLINEIRPEDGKTILEASFSVLNTSGKYNPDGVYEGTSLGNFGIGSKLQNYLSTKSEVTTYQNGKYEHIIFKDGLFESRDLGSTKEPNGTRVSWYPDKQFFQHIEVDEKVIIPYIKTLTCLIKGLEIVYNGKSYVAKNGLNDLVDEMVGSKEIISNRMIVDYSQDKYKLNLIMTYTSNYSSTIIPYVNTGLTDTGAHITQLKTTLTREMNKFFREKKWLKDKDENLTGDDIQEGLYIVFNYTAPNVSYDAQVKSRITAIDTKPETSAFVEELVYWLNNNEKEIKTIADKAIGARKAREAAKKARDAAREGKKTRAKRVVNPDKLKDAEHLGQDSILLAVEGLSAAASMAVARDTDKYGILALRGKPLNLLTNKEEKIAKNEEIQLLLNGLGIIPGAYDSSKLRYGKLAIASDSDSDGYHIGLLLAANIMKLAPEFIKEGRLCWLRSPLYIVKNGKNESYYYTDEEMDEAKAKGIAGEVQRNKGLGSLSAEQAHNSMFTEKYQKLEVLEYSEEAFILLSQLMGDCAVQRKMFIFNNVDFTEIKE